MAGEGSRPGGAEPAQWFVLRGKVALVVAISKTTPPGMSVREHAEALAGRLKAWNEGWRTRAQELQREVLSLRQEVLAARATSDRNHAADGTEDQLLARNLLRAAQLSVFGCQDLIDSLSSSVKGAVPPHAALVVLQEVVIPMNDGYLVDTTVPGSCGPGSDSETPELLRPDVQLDMAPCQPVLPSCNHCDPLEHVTHLQMHFLQLLTSLQRVSGGDGHRESLRLGLDGSGVSMVVESVCHLLDSVVTACRDPPPPGRCDVVLKACQVAAQAINLLCCQSLPSAELRRHVEETLMELTAMLLHSNQQAGRLQAAETLAQCLTSLGSSSMSTSFLLYHILTQISVVADQLWRAFQAPVYKVLGQFSVLSVVLICDEADNCRVVRELLQVREGWMEEEDHGVIHPNATLAPDGLGLDVFPVDQYQNCCHLFWIVEELLRRLKVVHRVEAGSEQMDFLGHLERVFLLSDEFPLFSIYMWRIGVLLTSSVT
ncbi:meiosis-specific protein MEI4 [Aulostomus maculatus]